MSSRPTTTAMESPQDRRRRLEAMLRKKAEKSRSFPPSFAQQRLWLLDQLDPGNPVYHIPLAIRLSGDLDLEALNRALSAVVARHESLRTKIVTIDEQPAQVVEPARQLELPIVDLQHVDPSQRDAEVLTRAQAEVRKPFHLDDGPLFRVLLLRLSPTEHVLVAVVHHIISDDWSMGVLFYEVSVLYKAFHAGQPSPLKELPIQYADYAVWQRRRLQGEHLQPLLDYWCPKLRGLADLALPTDRPYPQHATDAGATESALFPLSLAAQVRDVGRGAGATLYMTMLAAFQVLLQRYSGADDIAVGSPIAARVRTETEGLFGFFANTLVMRANLAGDPTFIELLHQVRETVLEALQHQEMPFDRLVEAINPDRDTGRHPLFQVAFVLQNAPWPDAKLPGLSLSPIPLDTGTSKFDLTVMAREERDGLSIAAEFRSQLFEPVTIQRMLRHFRNVLEAIVADPGRKLSELPIMDAAERRAMLVMGKAEQRPYAKDVCLHHLFETQVRRTPDAVAVCCEGQQLTYRQLNDRANRLGLRLRAAGVGPDAVVALLAERSLEMVVGVLGILKAGGAYMPVDPGYPDDRVAFMLAHSRTNILLAQPQFAQSLGSFAGQVIVLAAPGDRCETGAAADLDCLTTPDHAAYVIYTSGSTGQPKGVVIPHRAISNHMFWMAEEFPLDSNDAVLQKTPFSFDASVWEFHATLMAGARLVMAVPGGHLDPAYLASVIQKERITILQLVPTLLQMLVAEPSFAKCASLRRIFVGGEALPRELARRTTAQLGAELCNLYGPTEAAVDATFFRWDNRVVSPVVPIGRPIANTEVYVLDARLKPVPVGVPGELYIGGPGLARGYLHRPDLTAARFVAHPFSDDPTARLYRTGDQVRWLPDGSIDFLGRTDQQVKIRGFRIELGEIETTLRSHSTVREAVVTAWDAAPGEKELAAYCVPRDGELQIGQLRDYLKTSLPDFMVPSAFVVLDAIPLNPNGKVDYRALPRPLRQRDPQTEYVAPRNPDEEALADIWREVLRLDRVGVYDNFFALGGHSLLATQVVSRIGHRLNAALPLREMFQATTIADLAQRVAAARAMGRVASQARIPVAPRDGVLLPSLTQEALWFLDQLERDRPTYTVHPTMRITGPLDVATLQRALSEISRRHEALRTRFPEVDGRPVQVIEPPGPWPLEMVDLSGLHESERTLACRRRVAQETQRLVDLQRGPLIRVTLIKLAADEHVLVAAAHHIIYDGWSLAIMTRELTALYRAYQSGQASPLPELPIQYADFAAWQRQLLEGEAIERLRAYWAKQLAGVPPLDLPIDYPRPAIRTTRGDTVPCDLSAELSEAVREFSRREGVTPFMTLLAAFQVLLHRYTGQDDFAVGSPVANRTRPETEPLIGYFINMLVLRSDVSGDSDFREVVRRVRQTSLDAYEHQELTLDRVVDAVKPPRDPSRHPLFQVMFVLQNNEPPALDALGLDVEPLEGAPTGDSAFFELTLAFGETAQGFDGSLNVNTDLFRIETAQRMVRHFRTLLKELLAEPGRPVSTAAFVSEDERTQLVVEWNSNGLQAPSEACVHDLFESQARQTPDAVALVDGPRAWTYLQLSQRANQLAHCLQAWDVGPDRLIAIRLPRSAEAVIAMLGVLKAGGAYLPLDPHLPADRMRFMIEDAGVTIVVTRQEMRSDLPEGLQHVICLDSDRETIERCPTATPASRVTPNHLAYVIYTSGSTGRPKGVMIEHRALLNYTHAATVEYGITTSDRVLQFASASFDAHVEEVYPCLTQGGTLLLRSDDMLDGRRFLELCGQWRLTFVTVPTGFWHELTASIAAERLTVPATLRMVVIGGERALPERVVTWFASVGDRVHLLNTYGPTEATVVATSAELNRADGREERVPIGRPLVNTRVYVLDQHAQLVPPGVRGELYIGGTSLARGYLNQPETTAERFVPDPFAGTPDARMFRTGDVVRWRSDGRLQFVGRTDEQVKIRGFRIEPGEIEQALREHPLLADATVVARERDPGDLQLVAYVAGRDGAPPTIEEMRQFLGQRLPDFMIPASFVAVAALPSTASGKVDRRALSDPDWSRSTLQGHFVAPRTPTERQLAEIWSDVLKVERIGVHDDFFELGGNSLLAVRLTSRVRTVFSVDLPLAALFSAPRLGALAQKIAELQASGATIRSESLVPRARSGPVPISVTQEPFWAVHHLFPGQPVINLHAAFPLTGELNVDALRQAINEIVRRHETQRTTFVAGDDGRPLQVIAPELHVELPVEDLSHLPAGQREEQVRAVCREEATEAFDLGQSPLFRLRLLRLSSAEHVMVVTTPHIISDGWSVQVLFFELAQLYEAFAAGRPSPLPDLPVQYADYALWQREYLRGENLNALMGYWKGRLTGMTSPELPRDRAWRTGTPHFRRYRAFRVSAESRARLERIRREGDATLCILLLAVFKVFLRRYSGADDIAVAIATANRRHRETQGMIGLFVNTLILRTDMSGDPTFREQLARVRQTAIEGFDHEEMPFEMLVQELQPNYNPQRFPLVQVLFNYHSRITAEQVRRREELSIGYLPTETGPLVTRHELTLTVMETAHDLNVVMQYDADLFDDETIERMEGHFQTLLAGVIEDPDRRLSQLPLMSDPERQQVLVEWNRPDREVPAPTCVHRLFELQVGKTPEAVAAVFEGQVITYAALNALANQLAHHLRTLGVGPEVLVGIGLERSLEMAAAILAVLKAGGAYVPLDPDYPRERLEFVVADCQPKVVLTTAALADKIPAGSAHVVRLDADQEQIRRQGAENPPCGTTPDNAIYVLYTSGSTGKPKGAINLHRGVCNRLLWEQPFFGLGPADRILFKTPLSFDPSVVEFFRGLLWGGRLVIAPPGAQRDPHAMVQLIAREGVTMVSFVPSMLRLLLAEESVQECRTLRVVTSGGESLTPDLVVLCFDRLGVDLYNFYGPTETSIGVTYWKCQREYDTIPIGRPVPRCRLYILDAHGNPVPIGVPGELYIGGIAVGRGYINRPELTAERFVPDPFSDQPGERLYRTGDRCRYLPDGNVQFLGRFDQQVKIRGNRVELGEVETAILGHQAVGEAAVVDRELAPGEKYLAAYVVTRQPTESAEGQAELIRDLRRLLKSALPDYMVPQTFTFLRTLPRLPNGKLDRRTLPTPDTQQRQESCDLAPRTPTEKKLAAIWAEELRLERVGLHDNFFEMGGHSLLAVRVMMQIRAAMSVDLPVADLFAGPTVAELANRVESARRGETPASPQPTPLVEEIAASLLGPSTGSQQLLVPLRTDGAAAPLFCIHALGGHVAAFLSLARALRTPRPVYGLQGRGLEAGQQPHDRIEAMATAYLNEIRAVQPHGPYLLSGWSMGGLIALETAQQLTAAGEEVAFVAMIDTHLSLKHFEMLNLDDQSVIRWIALHLNVSVAELKKLPMDQQWERIAEQADLTDGVGVAEIRRLAAVCKAHLAAASRYVPQPYVGLAALFQARESGGGSDKQWKALCPRVCIERVPGNHYSMLRKPQVQHLAARLDQHLAKAASTAADERTGDRLGDQTSR